MTTQEHIDGLIATIWYATQDRSVTNLMVARVLDWLNVHAIEMREKLEQGELDQAQTLESIQNIQLVIENLTGAMGGYKLQEITEDAYDALLATDSTEEKTIYLVTEEEDLTTEEE